MAQAAARLLAGTAPITVTLGKILYHPEAIMLAATPGSALAPVRDAAVAATREVTGSEGSPGSHAPWTPHITVCYSTSRQPAGPVIAALGRELPGSDFQVSEVSLVIQQGPERLWDWHPVATVRLGALPPSCVHLPLRRTGKGKPGEVHPAARPRVWAGGRRRHAAVAGRRPADGGHQ
jgi:hypothetical protein